MSSGMARVVRAHKIASVVSRLGLEKDLEITEDLEVRAGNAIVVRALKEKRVYSELELENGRMSKIFRGDIFVGALGRRRALRGFLGELPDSLAVGDTVSLLNLGGVIGSRAVGHQDLGSPVPCEVLGMPVREGRILNVADACLPEVKSLDEIELPPLVVVSATSMNAGKTRLISDLIQELSKGGLEVAGGKLTGVACLRDLISMEDHGACVTASFVDAGFPSTAELEGESLVRIARCVVGHLAQAKPDLVIVELGDGILGDYGVLDVLGTADFAGALKMHIFCASDLVGAWGGVRYLSEHGLEIDMISGPCTDNDVGVGFVERELGLPAINAIQSPEALAENVRRHLGIGT